MGQQKQKGFTIVELLIVIVVIGILATLVIVTFRGVQQKARNTKRQTDLVAINGHLEAFNGQNGYYPTLDNMNDASFVSTNMKGLDTTAFKDPTGSNNQLVSAPVSNAYAYVASPSGCDNTATQCTGYVLTATLEGGGTYVKKSN